MVLIQSAQRFSLLKDFLKPGQYLTLSYLQIDRKRGRATLLNAAHPPLIHLSDTCRIVERPGDPIGCFDSFSPGEVSFTVQPGDRIYLYSDGLIEEWRGATVSRSEGLEKLTSCLRQHRSLEMGKSIEHCIKELHPDPTAALDDLLLVGIEI